MSSRRTLFRKVVRELASLKLAVLIIISIGVVTAWGTIVEARFDALAAKKIVYSSIWMTIPMTALVTCLTAVMIDRWPWQKRHTGFVLAHIGIIILIFGSVVTGAYGVDGSLTLGIGDKGKAITVNQTDLAVYSSMDGSQFTKIFDEEMDFFLKPAQSNRLNIQIPDGEIRIIESYPYALREQKFIEDKENDRAGAAIRFQLQNPNVNMTEWMLQPSKDAAESKDLGPAQVLLVAQFPRDFGGRNAIVLRPVIEAGKEDRLEYQIHSARTGEIKKGSLTAGDSVDTGWMGIQFRLLKFLPRAKEDISYKPIDKPTPATNAAIRVEYTLGDKGKVLSQWMGLNSLLKLFADNKVYIVSYANRRLPLGFEMSLKKFNIGRYQGTMRAASYESVVDVPDLGERLISMNEPLKHAGFTFYQASFESDPSGNPVASVLSVNRDPGRGLKYFGSLLIVLGTLHLFYMKRRSWVDLAGRVKKENVS